MIAADQFKQNVRSWASELRVEPKEIHLREMKRKLASCSSRGRLTFDPSLLQADKAERARAILHELLHLKYPNHGKMFSSLLRAHMQRVRGLGASR